MKRKRLKRWLGWGGLFLIGLGVVVLPGCKKEPDSLVIADQYGLAYAPLQIMKEKKILEQQLPGVTIEWKKMGNTLAIREAMLTDQLDIGFMGIPPFLMAKDKGMPWKIITGLSRAPLGLMVNASEISQLADFKSTDRIAFPQLGSIQHILLSMACQRQLGDPKALDANGISMKHPEGMQALISGQEVKAHFTSPPFLFKEEEKGCRLILSGDQAFGGPFTFIVGVCQADIYQDSQTMQGMMAGLDQAIVFLEENRQESLDILSRVYDLDRDVLEDYLYGRGIVYEREVMGVDQFADFMYQVGYLERTYQREDVIWEGTEHGEDK